MERRHIRLLRKGDIFIFIFLALLGYFVLLWSSQNEIENPAAFIQINNVIQYELDLRQDQIIALKEFTPPVKVEVRNHSIGIIQNDCEQKICIKMGFISDAGQMIVCVPKKILIYISGNDQNRSIEAITG